MFELLILCLAMVPASFSGLFAHWCLARYRRWRAFARLDREWRGRASRGRATGTWFGGRRV